MIFSRRRLFQSISISAALSGGLGITTPVLANEIQEGIDRIPIEGTGLEISITHNKEIQEIFIYLLRRYFYEINSNLQQEDILDSSNIDNYHAEIPDNFKQAVKNGTAILISYLQYPYKSEEDLSNRDKNTLEDIFSSLNYQVHWGGYDEVPFKSYFSLEYQLGSIPFNQIVNSLEDKNDKLDEGPGTSTDMVTN